MPTDAFRFLRCGTLFFEETLKKMQSFILSVDMDEDIKKLNRILHEVGRRDGIKDLHLSFEKTAAITFKSGKKIFFEYVEETMHLFIYTPLMSLPFNEALASSVFKSMLLCNFLKLETGRGELSISSHMNQAIYQIGLDVKSLNADKLDHAINDLLRQRDQCIDYLDSGGPVTEAARPTFKEVGTAHKIARFNRR